MNELIREIPDPKVLLALEPEELGGKLLFLMRKRGGTVHAGNFLNELHSSPGSGAPSYPHELIGQISLAVTEAWSWLEAQGLLIPADGINGQNGWRRLSRRAAKMENEIDFNNFKVARLLNQDLLHPKIANTVWMAFIRGDYDVAALLAMKAVEVQVREAAGLGNELVGVKLVRKAFHPDDGILTDGEAEAGERSGRMDLFAGAIASYKNSHSHRDVNLDDPAEAVEIILLANHLLRIVDVRRKALKQSRKGADI